MRRVVLTGAGGYIGGRLVPMFLERGWDVHALVREPTPRLGVEETVADLAQCDPDQLLEAFRGAAAVVHLAGENELVGASKPALALSGTVVATERVSEACTAAGVARLVYMSTVHVYGRRIVPRAELIEDMRVEPRSAYAISRLASEHVAAALADGAYDLIVLRLTNSVGAPDDPAVDRWSLVANDLCRQGALEGRMVLRSSGTQWRDFVALSDVCGAVIDACSEAPSTLPAGTYNLGSGNAITVRALTAMIQDAFEEQTGDRPQLLAPDPEPDPPLAYHVSVERAARHGIRLDAPLSDAVAETVRFCLDHREELE